MISIFNSNAMGPSGPSRIAKIEPTARLSCVVGSPCLGKSRVAHHIRGVNGEEARIWCLDYFNSVLLDRFQGGGIAILTSEAANDLAMQIDKFINETNKEGYTAHVIIDGSAHNLSLLFKVLAERTVLLKAVEFILPRPTYTLWDEMSRAKLDDHRLRSQISLQAEPSEAMKQWLRDYGNYLWTRTTVSRTDYVAWLQTEVGTHLAILKKCLSTYESHITPLARDLGLYRVPAHALRHVRTDLEKLVSRGDYRHSFLQLVEPPFLFRVPEADAFKSLTTDLGDTLHYTDVDPISAGGSHE